MDVVRFAILRPVVVFVGILFVILFGLVALNRLPYQLSPNVTEPEISVSTFWPGATPYEIERDIIEEQEKTLKGLPNLQLMESTSSNASGQITLTFRIGTDVDDALLRVSNKLNEVPSYPENVERPIISATGSQSSPIIWMMLTTVDGNPRSIDTYRTYFENEIRQYLERVDGVAELFVGGGTESEMHVVVAPEKLAAYGLTIDSVINALRGEGADVSAGAMFVGRRSYRVRTVGEFRSADDIADLILKSDGQRRVRLSDVAEVGFGYAKKDTAIIYNGQPGIAMGVRSEPTANVLELTDAVESVVERLNESILPDQGLRIVWSYDQRPYIRGAINLLKQNILVGGILAVLTLLIFLRSFASTIIVGAAIPISVIGTFMIMQAAGTTLNVVSLAGIAFAVGMLVDNAIVVLENIDRHRSLGQHPFEAAYTGAREVWGAVLASTLTTVAVFLPIFFLKEEAGQLFRDIAVAVSAGVTISLFVSVLVIPMLTRQIFRFEIVHRIEHKSRAKSGAIERLGHGLRDVLMGLVGLGMRNWATRLLTTVALAGAAFGIVFALTPKMEYLPEGNRNLLINILIPPPGISYAERQQIGERIFEDLSPYFTGSGFPGASERLPDKRVGIERIFYVGSEQFMIFGVIADHEQRARELIPVCQAVMGGIPGFFGISQQAGVFQEGLGEGRTIDLDFQGANIDQMVAAAGMMFGSIMGGGIPDAMVQPIPSLEQQYPEVQFAPRRDRLRAVNMPARQFGTALDVLMDGRDVGDFKQEGEKKIDLVVKASERDFSTPEELYRAMIATPDGQIVPVSSLADMAREFGITQIRHLERNRTITLRVTPPPTLTLQEAMTRIEEEMIPALRAQGMLDGVNVSLSGTADKLTEVRRQMQWNFLLAVLITYLLMAALFGNFLYPLIIMFTVPMAAAGGFLGLRVVNLFVPQQFDVLVMLGFIMLVGVVVNNAILIVHQSLNNIRLSGMDHHKAVEDSVRSRIRPIYMSALTSITGMLPLVIAPGPGSELYRGLGSVMIGGLAVSTVFTIFLIPALLLFVIRWEKPSDDADPDHMREGNESAPAAA